MIGLNSPKITPTHRNERVNIKGTLHINQKITSTKIIIQIIITEKMESNETSLWRILPSWFWNQTNICLCIRDHSHLYSVSFNQTAEISLDSITYLYFIKINLWNNPKRQNKCKLQESEQGQLYGKLVADPLSPPQASTFVTNKLNAFPS